MLLLFNKVSIQNVKRIFFYKKKSFIFLSCPLILTLSIASILNIKDDGCYPNKERYYYGFNKTLLSNEKLNITVYVIKHMVRVHLV